MLRNDSAFAFTELPLNLTGVRYASTAWFDLEGDGDLDFSYGGETESDLLTSVFVNEGNDTFTELVTNLPSLFRGSMDWKDFDFDGDADLLMTGSDGIFPISEVYRNDGGGVFTPMNADLTAVFDGTGDWVDVDSDGDYDIALTGHAFAGPITHSYVNAAGRFTLINDRLPGVRQSRS